MLIKRGALIVAIVLTLAVLVALSCLAPTMHPVRRGTVADFWATTVGVNIGGASESGQGALALHNGRFVYNVPGMDDIWMQWVPESEAMASWPAAQAALEARAAAGVQNDPVAIGYQRWKSVSVELQMGIVGLNKAICVAISEKVSSEHPEWLARGDDFAYERFAVESCAQKMDWYWATFCFEFLFLGGLIWWIAWPVIRIPLDSRAPFGAC